MTSCNSDAFVATGSQDERLAAFKLLLFSSGNVPIYAYFYSPTCSACQAMEKHWQHFRSQCSAVRAKAKLVMINGSTSPGLFAHYNVTAVPRILVFVNGKKVDDILGVDLPRLACAFKRAGIRE